jgi:hypothetical protein
MVVKAGLYPLPSTLLGLSILQLFLIVMELTKLRLYLPNKRLSDNRLRSFKTSIHQRYHQYLSTEVTDRRTYLNSYNSAGCQWLTTVILANWEVEIGKIIV